MPDIIAAAIFTTHEGELTHFQQKTDAAGSVFIAWQVNVAQSNASYVHVEERDAQNRTLATWRVLPAVEFKIVTFGLAVAGRDLVACLSAHHISNEPGRACQAQIAVIPGVFTPFVGGEAGDSPFPEEVLVMPESPTEIDYAHIRADVHAEVQAGIAALVAQFGGGGVRQGIEDKNKDALVELLTAPDTDQRAATYRAALAAFTRDRCYEAIRAWFAPDVPQK